MGQLITSDAQLLQEQFKNAAKMVGIKIKYIYPVIEDVTIHSEIKAQFSPPIEMDIFFEEVPKVKTLKRVGWVSEDPNDKPIIAMVPFDTPYLQTKARIFIPPIGQAIPGRWFEITSITAILEYPDCYYCKLVPVFDTVGVETDRDQVNYSYIEHKRANQPEQDAPNNYPVNANFKFLTNI